MRAGELIREAWASARAQVVPSMLVAAISLAMCLTTLLTVGRTAAAEAQVLDLMEAAGSRQITVVDVGARGLIPVDSVAMLRGVPAIKNVFGLSAPVDATNALVGSGGIRIPTWQLHGDIPSLFHLEQGRFPRVGEALISRAAAEKLGLDVPLGTLEMVNGGVHGIVGIFSANAANADLAAGAIVAADGESSPISLRVEAGNYEQVQRVQSLVLGLIDSPDPSALSVTSPATLAALQGSVLRDLGGSNRSLVVLVLGAGAALIAVVTLGDILIRRRELGRRRALGIDRSQLVTLVVIRTMIPGAIGTMSGTAIGVAAVADTVPPLQFIVGLALLGVLSSALAALLPAAVAARQDPVRTLRTP